MIGSLRGQVIDRMLTGEVLVEVAGVGYRVVVSPSTAIDIGELGSDVFLHVHHHIREDAQTLYGFTDRDERVTFEVLISAHGVGPALALAILSVHPPASLARVIADDDIAALCLVPGVGKKTAQRLLVELKSKLDVPDLADAGAATSPGSPSAASPRSDVHDALVGLGYGPDEIREALRDLPSDGDPSSLLKEALSRLAVAR